MVAATTVRGRRSSKTTNEVEVSISTPPYDKLKYDMQLHCYGCTNRDFRKEKQQNVQSSWIPNQHLPSTTGNHQCGCINMVAAPTFQRSRRGKHCTVADLLKIWIPTSASCCSASSPTQHQDSYVALIYQHSATLR
jgi:hypothetical protein